jgi:hypothetical protein
MVVVMMLSVEIDSRRGVDVGSSVEVDTGLMITVRVSVETDTGWSRWLPHLTPIGQRQCQAERLVGSGGAKGTLDGR